MTQTPTHDAPAQPEASGRQARSPTEIPARGWKDVALRTWKQSSEDNVGVIAAGVAFYGFVAMVPLLGAGILIYGLVADPQTVTQHARSLTQLLPADIAALVGDQLTNVVTTSGGKKGLGLLLALAISLWGARNAAGSVIIALNIAYEEEEKRGFVRVTLLSLAMTAGAVVMAMLAGVAIGLLSALERLLPGLGPVGAVLWKLLTYVLLGAVAATAAAAMFRFAPSRERPRWVWITPGSVLFALVWIVLTLGFGFYVSKFGNYGATYGSLSAVVVLLTWLYLSSYVLLLAAELNSELEHQTAHDTTAGQERPLGTRGAWVADHVADGPGDHQGETPEAQSKGGAASEVAPAQPNASTQRPREHPILTSRVSARVGQQAGLPKVSMLATVAATNGLARLRRPGSARSGALLLLAAAGLALIRREEH